MANFFKPSTKKQSIGQVVNVEIKRLDINGCGVADYKNKPLFIDASLPGENVSVRVIDQKSKYARGVIKNIVSKSSSRVQAKCQHFLECGGCDLQHLALEEHLIFKQIKVSDLFSRNGINSKLPWHETIKSAPWNYRRKARIGVQYNKLGEATLGFRKRGSNQLTAIKTCEVLEEPLATLFSPLKNVLNKLSGKNPVGHLEVISTDILTVVVRQLVAITKKDHKLWQAFAIEQQAQVLIDNGKTIESLSAEYVPLTYKLSHAQEKAELNKNLTIEFFADDFIQVNHQVNKQMITQALDWLALTKQDEVLDLFCGLGNFTLPIAQQVKHVVGVEGVDKMVQRASANAKRNLIENAEFYQADLNASWSNLPWQDKSFSKVLLDPARAGAYQAISQLVKWDISTILYVSCDPTTLAKDAELLLSHGYGIEKISLIDMFCQTKHIETMVLFTKH